MSPSLSSTINAELQPCSWGDQALQNCKKRKSLFAIIQLTARKRLKILQEWRYRNTTRSKLSASKTPPLPIPHLYSTSAPPTHKHLWKCIVVCVRCSGSHSLHTCIALAALVEVKCVYVMTVREASDLWLWKAGCRVRRLTSIR